MPRQKLPGRKKQSGVRLDVELLKKLRHLAIDLERSFNSVVEEAIEDLLKKYHSKK